MTFKTKDLLVDILSIPSVNGTSGEQQMAEYIQQLLSAAGIDSYLLPVSDTRSNVIAHIPGRNSTKTVIWNGHLDTVAYGDTSAWLTEPQQPVVKDGRLYVRGSSDMKSGVAGMLAVLLQWQKEGRQPDCNITLILTCDEESGGTGAMAMLGQGILERAEAFFIAEPTSLQPCIAQKGCIWLQLDIKGKASHGSYPQEGVNALEEGFSLCSDLKSFIEQHQHDILGTSTAQITMIEGGAAPNITPENARFIMDLRTVPGLSWSNIEQFINTWNDKARQRSNNLLNCEYKTLNKRDAVSVNEEDPWLHRLEKQIASLYPNLMSTPVGLNFFTDASAFIKENDRAPMILFGPGEPDICHQPNEYVELAKYDQFLSIMDALFTQDEE